MAFQTTIFCNVCHTQKRVVVNSGHPHPSVCGDCEAKSQTLERNRFLAGRRNKSIEERLEMLEEAHYDNVLAKQS